MCLHCLGECFMVTEGGAEVWCEAGGEEKDDGIAGGHLQADAPV